jgi:uncharacterized protein involved in exopolysaccharide biosynthesis
MEVFENEKGDSAAAMGFLYRKRKIIIGFVGLSLALAAIVTLVLPKRFSSYGIVFPVSNNNIESVIEAPTFGYDVEADRMIQLLQSNELCDSVTQKFDLLNYYGINKSDPDWRDELREDFDNDVSFVRTPYMSIVITAETKKPELSSEIVNYIIDYTDGIRSRIFKQNQQEVFHALEKEYFAKKTFVDSLKNKMARLREVSQSDLIAILNPQGLIQTSGASAKNGESTEFERTLNQYLFEQSQLNEIEAKYEKAKNNCERPITKSYVVDRAHPSYKKVSPSLLINLAIAGIATFILTILILVISEKMNEVRTVLKKNE